MSQALLCLCLHAIYDTLQSPSNLHHWHISLASFCFLCLKAMCTAAHIFGASKVDLNQGHFTYCHDFVLKIFLFYPQGRPF